MAKEEIRIQMEKLWSETFGDTPDYIKLIFDNYFCPERIEYSTDEKGVLEAALISIPYEFKSQGNRQLKGLYLCGLATKKELRHKGKMSFLLEQINNRAAEEGYDFTFLIPSGEGIREYYRHRGYHNSFYKLKNHYVKGHKFGPQKTEGVTEYETSNKAEVIDFLKKTQETDLEYGIYVLQHTQNDWRIVLEEAVLSGNRIYLLKEGNRIAGLLILELEDREIKIKKIFAINSVAVKVLLSHVEKVFPEKNITVISDVSEIIKERGGTEQIWSPFFASNNDRTAQYEDISEKEGVYGIAKKAFPFGMIRILDIENMIHKIGLENKFDRKGYDDDEIAQILLRKPENEEDDELKRLLSLPEISFEMDFLLE